MTAQTVLLVVAVLAGVVALIGASAKFLQVNGWRGLPQSGRVLVLRESVALDPRRRLHLVQCGKRQVVLLTGGGQDLVIGWMEDS